MIISDPCYAEKSPEVCLDYSVTKDTKSLQGHVEIYDETIGILNTDEQDISEDEDCFSNLSSSSFNTNSDDDRSFDSCDSHLSDSSFTSDSSISSCSSRSEIEDNNCSNLTKEESQALHILSCFSRNNLSASACKDILGTMKSLFPNTEVASLMNFDHLLTYVDNDPVREVHYCCLCNDVFPNDPDVFKCGKVNCEGLRYKGSCQTQQQKGRQPRKCFVIADIKKQLKNLLQTPGNNLLWHINTHTFMKLFILQIQN